MLIDLFKVLNPSGHKRNFYISAVDHSEQYTTMQTASVSLSLQISHKTLRCNSTAYAHKLAF